MISEQQLTNWFTYHPPPDAKTVEIYEELRLAGLLLASLIVARTPPSADQTAAVRKVREAVWTANAAIACQGL